MIAVAQADTAVLRIVDLDSGQFGDDFRDILKLRENVVGALRVERQAVPVLRVAAPQMLDFDSAHKSQRYSVRLEKHRIQRGSACGGV